MNIHPYKRRIAGAVLGTALIFGTIIPSAQAQSNISIAALQTQIASLLAQIAELQAKLGISTPATSAACPYTWSHDLSIGATGVDVLKLQQLLNSDADTRVAATGFGSAGYETQYFGVLTAQAVSKFQNKYRNEVLTPLGLVNPTGYFGASSRAKANALYMMQPGTPSDDDKPTTPDLTGGAGSIDSFKLLSKLNNEEVGERQKDVEVAGLELKASRSSDIRLTAINIVFRQDTADSDFRRYADEVSVWLDGDEVARLDADEFTKRNNWSKNVSLDRSAVIRKGTTGELTIAVSGARTIDSADKGETWTVDISSVRYRDAQGASIVENPNTDPRTFSFEAFATAANVEFKIAAGDSTINDSRIIDVHATRDTDNVELMAFEVTIKGTSDVTLDSLPVTFSVTGAAHIDDLINHTALHLNGKRVGTENIGTGLGTSSMIVFNNLDLELEAGNTYEFIVTADFNSVADALDEGDTITLALGETETDSRSFDAEDAAGNNLKDAYVTGSVISGPHAVYDSGIEVTFVSSSETVQTNNGPDNDNGIFKITFDVKAFGDTVYLAHVPAATNTTDITATTLMSDGMLYYLNKTGTATTSGLTASVSHTNRKGTSIVDTNGIRIKEGNVARVTLAVVRTNSGNATDDGIYAMQLAALGWNTDNSTTYNVFDFNLDEFRTGSIYLN